MRTLSARSAERRSMTFSIARTAAGTSDAESLRTDTSADFGAFDAAGAEVRAEGRAGPVEARDIVGVTAGAGSERCATGPLPVGVLPPVLSVLPLLLHPKDARVAITKAAETRVFIPISREPERGSLGETF